MTRKRTPESARWRILGAPRRPTQPSRFGVAEFDDGVAANAAVETSAGGKLRIADAMKGATVAITGGTGSFGSTMVDHLLTRGVDAVHILSRDEAKQDDMRRRFDDPRLRFFLGDVRDYLSVAAAMVRADLVFHAAALKQVPSCEFFPLQAVKTKSGSECSSWRCSCCSPSNWVPGG